MGIVDMRHTTVATKSRSQLIEPGANMNPTRSGIRGGGENSHDAFVDLDAALEIVVRSRKPKAVELAKWLTRKGVEKVAEEHQKAIDEKDFEIALLDGDLAGTQDLVRQLEYTNTECQGEIHAKDQEIARRERENAMLRER